MKKIMFSVALTLVLSLMLSQQSWAQKETPYPTRSISYLICFDPGGQSDRVARLQQPHLTRILGQKVLIDYKVGGGGSLGWRELVRSKPDGYSIAGFNIPHVILQPLQQEVGYKTDQITPICLFQRTPLGLAVLNNSPFKTLQEFIDYGKKNPGLLTVGGSGTFSGYHMAALRFEKLSGTKVTYVPFTGSAPQMTAFLGGHVSAVFGASDDLTRFKDKLRVLAFATEAKFPGFPDVPTLKEKGIDMAEAVDRGSAAPPKTPDYIIKKLGAAFVETAQHPDVVAEMKKQGFIPIAMGPDESKAYLDKMTPIYKELAAGLKK
ncbi:MAG: tripartite tricarboxylate transporter substrate binding protein [Thermodesulfobacteriota bacterium]